MIGKVLKSILQPEEKFIWGFADLHGLLSEKFSEYNYGISIGRHLDNSIVDEISEGPTQTYFNHYKDVNTELTQLTGLIVEDLNRAGISALAISPSVSTAELDSTYYETLRTDLSHKMAATRAGLGWIGKTDLLITKKFGPRLRLVTILLKENPGITGKPVNKSKCGTCRVCVDVCPAGAANGKSWNISVPREEFYNPFICREQCAEFGRVRLSADARVCGICVQACPVGQ
jgi:epoxyqueuosine reductase